MPQVTLPTLMVAIQAIGAETRRLDVQIADTAAPEKADLQDVWLTYWKAAEELKRIYAEERARGAELPPYDSLMDD